MLDFILIWFDFIPFLLREKCPSVEFFLVRIFPQSNRIRRDTPYLSVFSLNAGKYGAEKTPHFDTFHAVFISFFIYPSASAATHFFWKSKSILISLSLFFSTLIYQKKSENLFSRGSTKCWNCITIKNYIWIFYPFIFFVTSIHDWTGGFLLFLWTLLRLVNLLTKFEHHGCSRTKVRIGGGDSKKPPLVFFKVKIASAI